MKEMHVICSLNCCSVFESAIEISSVDFDVVKLRLNIYFRWQVIATLSEIRHTGMISLKIENI